MRAAIYLRVSTAGQTGQDHVSLSVQEETCRRHIATKGGTVVEVLKDEARSGQDIDRPEYLRLFAMARARQIDVVVAYRLDRLGRDAAEYLAAAKRFKAYGVTIQSATEPSESALLAGLLALLAEEESDRIRKRTVDAHHSRLNEGRWVGRAPLGYRLVPHAQGGKHLESSEDAWKVTRLFELYADGTYGLRSLGVEAARLGLSSFSAMTKSNLSRMLTNPAYTGKIVWSRNNRVYDEDGHRHMKTQPKERWIVRDGDHKPLVDQATFDRVQVVLARNQVKGDPRATGRQLLVGLIYCKCGSRVQVNSNHGWPSYGCHRRRETGECDQPYVSVRKVDPRVKAAVETALRPYADPDLRAVALAELSRRAEADLDAGQLRRRHLEAMHQRVSGERLEAGRKYAQGRLDEDLFAQMNDGYKSQLSGIEAELADVPALTVEPDYETELRLAATIVDWALLSESDWREIFELTVERITLAGGAPEVTFTPAVRELALAGAAIRI